MTESIHKNLNEFSLAFEDLCIEIRHVENAMGRYKNGTPAPFPALIKKAMADIAPRIKIRGGYRYCRDIAFTQHKSALRIENATFSVGRIIGRQIKGLEAVAIFACTAGADISDLSKRFLEKGDLIQGYIFDTIGSVTVERAMDTIQQKIAESARREGRKITNRFSPGYCDWHLRAQHQLFSLLPHDFCGITLTESSLMQPLKSVSGIIGVGKKVRLLEYPCKICEQQKCYRRQVAV